MLQSRRHGEALVGLAPSKQSTKPPAQTHSPPIEHFLATVLALQQYKTSLAKRGQRIRSLREHTYTKPPRCNVGLTQVSQHVVKEITSFEMPVCNASGYIHLRPTLLENLG